MKFGIAAHMQRQHPGQSIEQVADELLDLVTFADQAGFDVAWAVEHHGHEHYIGPNPLTQLAHWAGHTERIRLGTAVLVAPYWHPLRLAGEVGMADLLTGGRLEVGIARGAFQYEFDRMVGALPQEQGRDYLFELIPAIQRLWAGDYEHRGEYWSFPTATATPKPLQKPHPPLWVAARDPQTFDFAIKHGLAVMSTPLRAPMSEVENLARKLDEALAANPGHRRPPWMVLRSSCVYERPADWRIPVDAIREYQRLFLGMFHNSSAVRNGFPEPIDLAVLDAIPDNHPEALRENLMFGTPDEVVAKLRRYETLGVDQFTYMATFGLPHDVAMRGLRLFAEEVMPHFREGPKARTAPSPAGGSRSVGGAPAPRADTGGSAPGSADRAEPGALPLRSTPGS